MAEKRMFSQKIIDSDAFLDMPLSTQALYFHLSMRADDEGFINNPKKITRMLGCNEDELKLLCAKKFIIPFESGIVVIKHWRIHNYIAKDRFKETNYKEEKAKLSIDENNVYTECIQNENKMDTQIRIDKNSIDKNSIDIDEPSPTKKVKHKYGEYENVLLTDEEIEKLRKEFPDLDERIEKLSSYIASFGKSYKSHYATIRNWARREKEEEKKEKKAKAPRNAFNSYDQREYSEADIAKIEQKMVQHSSNGSSSLDELLNKISKGE